MMSVSNEKLDIEARKKYLRPLLVSMCISIVFELFIFILFGLILYPNGSVFNKLIWTIFYCGIGMGCVVGAWIDILVVDRFSGIKAVLATMTIAVLFLSACDALCLALDHKFRYFGGHDNPILFFVSGIIMSIIGGLIGGVLLFTSKGNKILSTMNL